MIKIEDATLNTAKGPKFYLKRLIIVWTTALNEIKFSSNTSFHDCMHTVQLCFMAAMFNNDVLQLSIATY